MARSKLALKDFLERRCRVIASMANGQEVQYYVLNTENSRPFMAYSHIREVLQAVGQHNALNSSRQVDDNSIIVYPHKEPETGIDQIKFPVKFIAAVTEQQSFQILRNLEGIQRDIDEGKLMQDRLEGLFQDTATVKVSSTPGNERVYLIKGRLSSTDRRLYMERFAEQIASSTLFDVAKALNSRLEPYIPEESREKFFVEGRDLSDRKVKYGAEVGTELMLSDEGAYVYTDLAGKSPTAREVIAKVFQQAMLDPFGLSMRHYMGKHNVLKAGKRPLVKVPGVGSFVNWVKGLFGSSET